MFDDPHTLSGGHPYRRPDAPTPSAAGPVAAGAGASRPLRIFALCVLVLSGWIAVIGWREHRLNVAVAAMPVAAQRAAYRRAYDDLSTMCAAHPQLDDHCAAQAEFILRFPQCSAECDALARRYLFTHKR
jgi:hypothetical protein